MANQVIGREVTRGTIWRDRWHADVRVMCSDWVPAGGTAPLIVDVRWRFQRDDGSMVPGQPEDAAPIRLTLRKVSAAASGDIAFDASGTTRTRGFQTDTRQLITLHALATSSSTEPDVALDVFIENDKYGCVPLAVRPARDISYTLSIVGGSGGAAPEAAVADEITVLSASPTPTTAGTVTWAPVTPNVLTIIGAENEAAVSVRPIAREGAASEQIIAALFHPTSGPDVMITHALRIVATAGFTGRIVDSIGQPISGATVHVRAYTDQPIATVTTRADGTFTLEIPFRQRLDLEISHGETTRHIYLTPLPGRALTPQPLGDLRLTTTVVLTDTVGDGGANQSADVRRVQQRLAALGRLTAAQVAAEPVDLTQPTANVNAMPQLIAAIYAFNLASFGERLPLIHPNDPTLTMLNTETPFPTAALMFANNSAVGELLGTPTANPPHFVPPTMNPPAQVRPVQDRLFQLGFLSAANYRAERVNPAAAPNPVPVANLRQTIEAIKAFEHTVALGALKAIVYDPTRSSHNNTVFLLNDPYLYSYQSLRLSSSVGVGGTNLPADVRAVQDRLFALGRLTQAHYNTERANPLNPAAVNVATIPQTLAALNALAVERGVTAAPLFAQSPALERLNHPPRIVTRGTVGRGGTNNAADVSAVQRRLRALNLLSQANLDAEIGTMGVNTLAALQTYGQRVLRHTTERAFNAEARPAPIALSGGVGAGLQNRPADVRAVQDRLHEMGLLSDADYTRQRVDPAAATVQTAALTATFDALTTLKREVMGLPAAMANRVYTAHGNVEPGTTTEKLLNDPLFYGYDALELSGPVGVGGYNRPFDMRAVQDRLRDMRLLPEADHTAEAISAEETGARPITNFPQTQAAIARFRHFFMGEGASETDPFAVIEAIHPVLTALSSPFPTLSTRIDIINTIGRGGSNAVADLRLVQTRLVQLGFLAAAHIAEGAAGGAIGDAQIPNTIAAIELFQRRVMGQGAPSGRIAPLDATLRQLNNPRLPVPGTVNIAASVGNGATNNNVDIRPVQDRLHRLGYLSTADYLAERVNGAAGGSTPGANLPRTIAAIRSLQQTAAGERDQRVDPNGNAEKVLNDPTHSTPTVPNPHTDYRPAGPAMPTFNAEVTAIILAIEAHEAGGSNGEVPAILSNGSQTAASYGKAQVIGGTGRGIIQAENALRDFYGFTNADLVALRATATSTSNTYDAIYATEVVAVMTEAALVAAINAYTTAHLAQFHRDTGLGAQDIARMFRTAQFRRQLHGHGPGDLNTLLNPALNPDIVTNVNALNITRGSVNSYLTAPRRHGEHHAGFVTRALFYSAHGQRLRNAMTDDSGFKIGRYVIRDNFNRVVNRAAALHVVLDQPQRARITVRIHNSGPGGLDGYIHNPATAENDYVVDVLGPP